MADVKWLIYRLEQMAQTPLNYDAELVRETIAALSHAAGQEVVDRNVEAVRTKMLDRSRVGLAKYGVTTERGDLSLVDWMRHLQEELMDAAVYIEAAVARSEGEDTKRLDWLLAHPTLLTKCGGFWFAAQGDQVFQKDSAREAIDAARAST